EKTSLEPLKLAIKKLSLSPKEILLVGDSIERDIEPAKKVGLRTALAQYGQEKKEKGKADFNIKKIDELLKVIGYKYS
ncbi:MAG: HAD hydrolase-like protein, partial [Candidatus Aenigmatarchaeota archaeon]